ncbi:MAG TPA: hypothetical protein VL727_01550 [Puia sp.]|jgi:hypothetical protein|nr:hypothetical protein [Puia sp.]
MKRTYLVVFAALLSVCTISCGKSGGKATTPPDNKSKSFSVKITVSPVIDSDHGSFTGSALALLPNSGYATWKVNGVTRTAENNIVFTTTDLKNGVITLETTANVNSVNLDVSGVTVSQPFTVLVAPTINGTADSIVSIPVTSTMQRSFTY